MSREVDILILIPSYDQCRRGYFVVSRSKQSSGRDLQGRVFGASADLRRTEYETRTTGRLSPVEVGAFLSSGNGPEQQALLRLTCRRTAVCGAEMKALVAGTWPQLEALIDDQKTARRFPTQTDR